MWFDTHAHLFLLEKPDNSPGVSDGAVDEIIQSAFEHGVSRMLCVGIDVESSRQSIRIAQQYPGRIFAAVGIHPNSAKEFSSADWDEIVKLATKKCVVAIGETGLDWYRNYTPRDVQLEWFERHWALSRQVGKPLVVHCRDAEKEMTEMLLRWSQADKLEAVMHACAASWDIVKKWLDLEGIVVSFAGSVTYKNTKYRFLRETAAQVPLDRILVETDCPYLVPEPYRGRVRMSLPSHVTETGRFLATLRGLSEEDCATRTTQNALRIFGLPG